MSLKARQRRQKADTSAIRVWIFPGIYPYDAPDELWKGIFIHRQARALRSSGVDVRVVQLREWCPPWPLWRLDSAWRRAHSEWRPARRVHEGVPIAHPVVFAPRPSRLFRKSYRERAVERLVRFLKAQDARADRDVLLCHWLIPDGYIGVRAALELKVPCAVEMWGDDVLVWPHWSPRHMRQAQWVLGHASALLACSHFLGAQGAKLGAPGTPIKTVYNGVDLEAFCPMTDPREREQRREELGLARDDSVLLSVGTAIRRKGWLELLDALQRLRGDYPRLKLLAVHAGVPELDLDAEARCRGLTERFVNLGEVAPEVLPRVYQAADLFCLPSHWEGLANALLEAMSSGLPVVTTAVAGHPEVVEPGISGELVPRSDTPALVQALRKVLARPEKWPEYGRHARAAAERVGSLRENAEGLLRVLESIRQGTQDQLPQTEWAGIARERAVLES